MDHQTIKSYLVKLGFAVDKGEASKFSEAIKKSATDAERFAKDLTKSFAAAGLAVVGTLAAVGVGLVDLFASSANADLKFQILGRRMLTTTSVAREMSIALDAMGVSLEDIIGGPPELGQRYTRLIAYQQGLEKALLGPNFEESMYKIRMVEEEFTKAKIAAQYLGMTITEEVVERLTGTNSLSDALAKIDAYLTPEKIKHYADVISNVLVPAIESAGRLLKWAASFLPDGSAGKVQAPSVNAPAGDPTLTGPVGDKVMDIYRRHPGIPGSPYRTDQKATNAEIIQEAIKDAAKYKISPYLLEGLVSKESNFNPNAVNPASGAFGLGQFMFDTGAKYGITPQSDWQKNLEATAHYLSDLLQSKGGEDAALKAYGGWVTKDPGDYINDVRHRAKGFEFMDDRAKLQPQAYNLNMGGITVNVDKSNASAQEIALQVREEVAKDQQNMWRQLLVNSQGVHA